MGKKIDKTQQSEEEDHESEQENPEEHKESSKQVFVSGLPYSTNEEALKEFLKTEGGLDVDTVVL